MKSLMYGILFILFLNFATHPVSAAPPQEEVEAILAEMNWDMATLEEYLAYFELSLENFETADDLRMILGTPITPENLAQLLSDYGMSEEQLDALLSGFGESIEDYYFIEDLDLAVDFYVNHDSQMKEFEDFLTLIGVTEEEADNLFNHFMALDETNLEEQMETVGARLENLMTIDPEAEITDAQKNELIAIWDEIMASVNLSPKFYLVNETGNETAISYSDLIAMDEYSNDALKIELYNAQGTLILDMQVSAEMLGSEFAINAGEKLTDIGDLAGELTELKHERLPDTASPYGINMVMGLLALLSGIALYFTLARRNKIRVNE